MMTRTRALATGAVGALLVVAATSAASPWWTLHRLQSAVARRDAGAVSAQVDFPALRDSVKSQVLASMGRDADKNNDGNPFAAFGSALAMAFVNPLIDAIVSPAGVSAMVEHGRIAVAQPQPQHAPEAADAEPVHDKPRYALAYRGWDRFAVTAQDGGSFVFRRDGLWTWKLAGIEMPRR
jgi:hypothetical protein